MHLRSEIEQSAAELLLTQQILPTRFFEGCEIVASSSRSWVNRTKFNVETGEDTVPSQA